MTGKTVPMSDAEFEQRVHKSDKPVIGDFWAPWCPPCRVVAPTFEDLAGEYDGKLVIAKVNTDDDSHYMAQYGIMSPPTTLFFNNGQLVDRVVGGRPRPYFKARIDAMLQEPVTVKS
jgi:thioredoxin 1